MRKNLLIATLVGLGIIGLTACSKGEENKSADQTTQAAVHIPGQQPNTAAAQQPTATPPGPSSDNTSYNDQTAQPIQAASSVVADSGEAMPSSAAPAAPAGP